jgi:hypothetical protein
VRLRLKSSVIFNGVGQDVDIEPFFDFARQGDCIGFPAFALAARNVENIFTKTLRHQDLPVFYLNKSQLIDDIRFFHNFILADSEAISDIADRATKNRHSIAVGRGISKKFRIQTNA